MYAKRRQVYSSSKVMNTSNKFRSVLPCRQHPVETNAAQALLTASHACGAFFGCCVPRRRASRHCRPTSVLNHALYCRLSLSLCACPCTAYPWSGWPGVRPGQQPGTATWRHPAFQHFDYRIIKHAACSVDRCILHYLTNNGSRSGGTIIRMWQLLGPCDANFVCNSAQVLPMHQHHDKLSQEPYFESI